RNRLFVLQHASLALSALVVLALALSAIEAWWNPGRNGDIALFSVLVLGVLAALMFFSKRLGRMQSDDRTLAHFVEGRIPDLEQRLLTSLEFSAEEADGRG